MTSWQKSSKPRKFEGRDAALRRHRPPPAAKFQFLFPCLYFLSYSAFVFGFLSDLGFSSFL
jgi:hypothetical protein